MKILIVDDEKELLESLCRGLVAKKYVVETAENGQQGWEILSEAQEKPFDLIIMDINMPVLNGLDFLKKMRDEDYETPVVIMTGHKDLEYSIQAVRLNAFDFLLKPFKFQQLTLVINRIESFKMPAQKLKDFLPFYEEKIQIVIPSRLEFVHNVIERFRDVYHSMFQLYRISETQVSMCLVEALTNSIIHGNLEVPSSLKEESWDQFYKMIAQKEKEPEFGERSVHLSYHLTAKQLSIEIQDQGKGFDTKSLPNPTDPSNLLASSGRGLFLIRVYMDEVEWNDTGNHIRMIKYLN